MTNFLTALKLIRPAADPVRFDVASSIVTAVGTVDGKPLAAQRSDPPPGSDTTTAGGSTSVRIEVAGSDPATIQFDGGRLFLNFTPGVFAPGDVSGEFAYQIEHFVDQGSDLWDDLVAMAGATLEDTRLEVVVHDVFPQVTSPVLPITEIMVAVYDFAGEFPLDSLSWETDVEIDYALQGIFPGGVEQTLFLVQNQVATDVPMVWTGQPAETGTIGRIGDFYDLTLQLAHDIHFTLPVDALLNVYEFDVDLSLSGSASFDYFGSIPPAAMPSPAQAAQLAWWWEDRQSSTSAQPSEPVALNASSVDRLLATLGE